MRTVKTEAEAELGIYRLWRKILLTFASASVFTLFVACYSQNTKAVEQAKETNPLLCDPETEACETPGQATQASDATITHTEKPLKVLYFTDPICSSCWGIEPQLRRLKLEYGDLIDIEYHMGGLLPDWSYDSGGISQPSDVAHHWDEVSETYDMPIDGDVWLEDPLDSSYPPSIAFKAAQIQDEKKAIVFLRKMRELLFLEKKNICRWEHVETAAEYSGLDAVQLKKDYEGRGMLLFQQDLELGQKLGVRGFPSIFFVDSLNNQEFVYGSRPYANYEQAIKKLHPNAEKKSYPVLAEALFAIYPTLMIREFAELTGLERESAKAQLEGMFEQGVLRKVETKNGDMYVRNGCYLNLSRCHLRSNNMISCHFIKAVFN
jgi:putative protein-disulfide isomerase